MISFLLICPIVASALYFSLGLVNPYETNWRFSRRCSNPEGAPLGSTNPVGGYEGGMASERFCGVCWASERFCGASERFCVGSVVGAIWEVIYKMILE